MPDSNNPAECSKKEGKHPLEYFIAVFLVLTFIATAIAACYTRQQWLTADDTEKRNLCAYVGVSRPRLRCPDCGNPIYNQPRSGEMTNIADLLEFVVKASGVTPAYNVHLRHVDWEPIPNNILYPFGFAYVEHTDIGQVVESRATLLPSESQPFQVPIIVKAFVGPKLGNPDLQSMARLIILMFSIGIGRQSFALYTRAQPGADEFTSIMVTIHA